MLKPYTVLFVIIFKFLKVFEGGWVHQTDGHRAFESVLGISVLVLINSLVIFPDAVKGTYSYVFIVSFVISASFFLPKKRYLRFLEEYKSYKNKATLNAVAITYSVLTLLSMIYYAYFS